MTSDRFDEDSMRRAVQSAFSQYSPISEMDEFQDRIRSGARRSRAVRRTAAGVGGIAALAAVAVLVGLAGSGWDRQDTSVTAAPPPCPSTDPLTIPTPTQAGADKELAPGHPLVGTYCDFAIARRPGGATTAALSKSGTLTGSHLTAVLRAVRTPLTGGLPRCPNAVPSEVLLLIFRYPSGSDLTVSVMLHGCPIASNGTLTGMFAPAGVAPSAIAVLGDRT